MPCDSHWKAQVAFFLVSAVLMAGWDRYGEDKKYRKDVDVNDNPKHVGEPLRKLTLEDRLEIRRQVREQQKKRVHTAEINEDLESDDVDFSTATTPSKRPKVGTKATSPEEVADGELDIIGVASNGKKRNEVVDLADEDATQSRAAAIRRARRKAKAKAAKAKGKASAPAEVEVLE